MQEYRKRQVAGISNDIGVYALCDLDKIPVYVGQSVDGFRARITRHLGDTRTDIFANGQVDLWDIGYVLVWKVDKSEVNLAEAALFNLFNSKSTLMNGAVLPKNDYDLSRIGDPVQYTILPDEEITDRRDPSIRFPRKLKHIGKLVEYILEVSDKHHLRRSLYAHNEQLNKLHRDFQGSEYARFAGEDIFHNIV
jgi:hypothetical protein